MALLGSHRITIAPEPKLKPLKSRRFAIPRGKTGVLLRLSLPLWPARPLKHFNIHAVWIFYKNGVSAAAKIHNLGVGGDHMNARGLHLGYHAVEVNHLNRHGGRARVADAQMELGARHAAKLSEFNVSGRAGKDACEPS